ncbi:MAG: hypothetical protein P4L85_06150 [Paludisphaera borealis]|uniref:hypothetical protein n=1 Tax=Paludisphaera borealis TaxID=1387353 RepID=UPI002846E1AF|nr:hypothetical protein [Paludisphaera borealis]MDR3618914.1 hypothetical protein [Paludisphaera borealis]
MQRFLTFHGMEVHPYLEASMLPSLATVDIEVEPEFQLSLHQRGEEEAQRFKWIESEKAGRDLGETAIRLWICRHWNSFLRQRWLEHLQGKAFWVELDHRDFGVLRTCFAGSRLIDPIIDHFKRGHENLDILLWAMQERLPMEEVRDILTTLDVNSARIQCQFDPSGQRYRSAAG